MEIQETRVYGLRVRVHERAVEDPVEVVALAVRNREKHNRPVVSHDGENYDNVYMIVDEGPDFVDVRFLFRQSRVGPHDGWNCYRHWKPFLCRHPRHARRFLDFRAVIHEPETVSAFCYTAGYRLHASPKSLLGRPLSAFLHPELVAAILESLPLAEVGGPPAGLFLDILGSPAAWITRHGAGWAEVLVRSTMTAPDIAAGPRIRPPRVSLRLGRRNGLRLVWSREEDEGARALQDWGI